MKKLIFLFIAIGSVVVMTKNPGDTASVSPKGESSVERVASPEVKASSQLEQVKKTSQTEVSLSDLELKFQNLEIKDVEKMLDSLENSPKSRRLIELSNTRELTEDEKHELVTVIRTKAALTKLLIEKTSQDMELL